jgi:hypothetical protein
MSEATQPEKPAASAAATAEKPAAPAEPPFTTDDLQSSTARFTHKAWYIYYNNRKDMKFIRETDLRATLEARTTGGAEELQKLLTEAGAKAVSRMDKLISFTATLEVIQTVIKHPETFKVDAVKI